MLRCGAICLQSVIILISVTKELPVGSKFSQWSAMKRHWKNMYGYRLDGVFYNISFWGGRSVVTLPIMDSEDIKSKTCAKGCAGLVHQGPAGVQQVSVW